MIPPKTTIYFKNKVEFVEITTTTLFWMCVEMNANPHTDFTNMCVNNTGGITWAIRGQTLLMGGIGKNGYYMTNDRDTFLIECDITKK